MSSAGKPGVGAATDGTTPKTCGFVTMRSKYNRLLHELQFRATRNALMNYHEAERLEKKKTTFSYLANTLTGVSGSSLLVGVLQKGQLLASKAGVVGTVGLVACGAVQLIANVASESVPNHTELAKKHIKAAAGWASISETARVERMRIKTDPERNVDAIAKVYNDLITRRAEVSSVALVSQATHKYFSENPDLVCAAVKRRGDNYAQFVELEKQELPSLEAEEGGENIIIYF